MLPGRFPSPKPSFSACAILESTESLSSISPRGKQLRDSSPNHIAPMSHRMRPYITSLQSEPSQASTASAHTTGHLSGRRRIVSDPLLSHTRMLSQSNGSPVRVTKQRRPKRASLPQNRSIKSYFPYQSSTHTDENSAPGSSGHSESTETSIEEPKPTKISELEEPVGQERAEPKQDIECSSPPKSAQNIHTKITNKLLQPVSPSKKKGIVYIILNPQRPDLGLKIGSTANWTDRMQYYRKKCGFTPRVLHRSIDLGYYERAEKLCHADLDHLCQSYLCQCGTKHREFFTVEKGVAVETVERWVKFMREEKPYGGSGQLRPVWKYLLEKRKHMFQRHKAGDHVERRKHWGYIISAPSRTDEMESAIAQVKELWASVVSNCHAFGMFATTFFWQLATVLYALVTVAHFKNKAATMLFAAVFLGASMDMWSSYGWLKLQSPRKVRGQKC